jgi:ATP-dependent RNA helicase DeaD
VFCHTKRDVDIVALKLREMGYNSDAIHGDYSQFQRNMVMKKFKEGEIDILVATDVAARGLDIQDVTHVINYSMPQNPESYIHRIGRTGRAGKSGIAILFITPKEYRQLRLIEKSAKTRISKAKLPTPHEVIKARQNSILADIIESIESEEYINFLPLSEKVLQSHDPKIALAAVMGIAFEDISMPQENHDLKHGAMSRLFMTTGKKDGITAKDIVKTFTEEAGVPFKEIGRIALMESFTFVEVSKDYADRVIQSLDRLILKGKKVRVEKAREKKT